MYVVHNVTSRTVMLSDLRAEIKPRGLLDLERVATRTAVENSKDLQAALRAKILHLGRHSVIRTKESPAATETIHTKSTVKVVEKERDLDERKLADMIRQVIKETTPKIPEPVQPKDINVQDKVKEAVKEGVDGLLSSIRDQINNIQPIIQTQPQTQEDEMEIDPEKFAEISQNAVKKISQEIETGRTKLGKKYKINKNLRDLADDL